MDSKIGQDEADKWFYESFRRYKHLFMYELEAPVDTMELLDATNLCTTGVQSFSKKCEILQLAVPPKLLPKDIEEGLCKDRDFKIICGGYSSTRVLQIEPMECEKIVAAVQAEQEGVGLFRVGDDESGVIREESRLELPAEVKTKAQSNPPTGMVASKGNKVIFCEENSKFLCQWSVDSPDKSNSFELEKTGRISKALYWDNNVISLCSNKGSVNLYDLRVNPPKPELEVKLEDIGLVSAQIQYSFDVKTNVNIIGVCDTLGHFQLFDTRKPSVRFSQITIPGYAEAPVLNRKFNLRFQKLVGPASDEEVLLKFIISGFKEEIVPVYKCLKSAEILPIFTHDGHTKTVTNAMWHNMTDNLLFSASTDAVLHAWQFVENND